MSTGQHWFSDWMIVPIMAVLAVAGLVLVHQAVNQPVQAEILTETANDIGGDMTEVAIQWSFASSPDEIEAATVRIPASQLDEGSVPVWRDGEDGFTTVDPRYQLTLGDYMLALALGGLLGAVMVMTIRGYGYVRGTGEPGSRPSVDVAEDRGFYWRT